MKHLRHLVNADVRRFSLLLAVWVLIQVMDTVFRSVRPVYATDRGLVTVFELLATILFVIRWLGMIFIVPLVVQTHALVGSDAFWMTRPIPWRALLAAKAVLLGATFVAVPALCELSLMLVFRVPFRETSFVTFQTILLQSFWLSLVMALATMTRNLARFALVSGSVLVALVLLFNIAIAVMIRNMPDRPELTGMSGRAVESAIPAVAMLIFLSLAAVVLVVVQYRTRSTRASVAAGVVSVVVAVLIVVMWPWPHRPLPIPEWASRESALRLVAESQLAEFRPMERGFSWNGSGEWQLGSVRLSLSAVEAGWLPTVKLADGTMQFPDGTTVATAGNGYSSPVPFASGDEAPLRVVTRQVLGVDRVLDGSPNRLEVETMPAMVLAEADFRQRLGTAGVYRGRFQVDLDHVEIAATLPLQAGAEFQERRRRIVIDQVIPEARGASIRVRHFTAVSMFDSDALPGVSFYLRNRATSEAVAGSAHEGMAMSTSLALPLLLGVSSYSSGPGSGFSVTGGFTRFPGGYGTSEQVDISPEWLSQAELVILRTASAGSVMRTLEVPGLEIIAASPRLPR